MSIIENVAKYIETQQNIIENLEAEKKPYADKITELNNIISRHKNNIDYLSSNEQKLFKGFYWEKYTLYDAWSHFAIQRKTSLLIKYVLNYSVTQDYHRHICIEERPDLKKYKYSVYCNIVEQKLYTYDKYLDLLETRFVYHDLKNSYSFQIEEHKQGNEKYLKAYNNMPELQKNFKTLEEAIDHVKKLIYFFNNILRAADKYNKIVSLIGKECDRLNDILNE